MNQRQHVVMYLVGEVPKMHDSTKHINSMIGRGWAVQLMVSIGGGVLVVTFMTSDDSVQVVPVPEEPKYRPRLPESSGGHNY